MIVIKNLDIYILYCKKKRGFMFIFEYMMINSINLFTFYKKIITRPITNTVSQKWAQIERLGFWDPSPYPE